MFFFFFLTFYIALLTLNSRLYIRQRKALCIRLSCKDFVSVNDAMLARFAYKR